MYGVPVGRQYGIGGWDWVVVEEGEGAAEWASGPEVEAAATSRPVVKALGPAPERMMARTEGEEERWEKRRGRWSHILG